MYGTFFYSTKYFHDLWLTGCQICGPDVWSDLAHVVKGVSHSARFRHDTAVERVVFS